MMVCDGSNSEEENEEDTEAKDAQDFECLTIFLALVRSHAVALSEFQKAHQLQVKMSQALGVGKWKAAQSQRKSKKLVVAARSALRNLFLENQVLVQREARKSKLGPTIQLSSNLAAHGKRVLFLQSEFEVEMFQKLRDDGFFRFEESMNPAWGVALSQDSVAVKVNTVDVEYTMDLLLMHYYVVFLVWAPTEVLYDFESEGPFSLMKEKLRDSPVYRSSECLTVFVLGEKGYKGNAVPGQMRERKETWLHDRFVVFFNNSKQQSGKARRGLIREVVEQHQARVEQIV